MIHGETLRLKPRRDFRMIAGAETEPVGVVLWREPFVKLRRGRILLVREQSLQIGLLLRGRLEHDQDVIHLHAGIDRALIEFRVGELMDRARNGAHARRVHGFHDPVSRSAASNRQD